MYQTCYFLSNETFLIDLYEPAEMEIIETSYPFLFLRIGFYLEVSANEFFCSKELFRLPLFELLISSFFTLDILIASMAKVFLIHGFYY